MIVVAEVAVNVDCLVQVVVVVVVHVALICTVVVMSVVGAS